MNHTNAEYIDFVKLHLKDPDVLKSAIRQINNNDRGLLFVLNAKMK